MNLGLGIWKSSKKNIRFLVDFQLEELTSVPFVAGVFFAKLNLLHGGHFKNFSSREEIFDHRVCWNGQFQFECKLTATLSTGILDECICKISVRRESRGGKSYQKLGFAKINLAEFAGGTPQSRSYLLEQYNSSARANNALLRVTISMRVSEGDFCFKVPIPASMPTYFSESFPGPTAIDLPEAHLEKEMGQGQGENSRKSSSPDSGVFREMAMAPEYSNSSLERKPGLPPLPTLGLDREKVGPSRVDSTRVDAENLVDELLRETNLESSSREGGGGLTLFIGKDGKAAVIGD